MKICLECGKVFEDDEVEQWEECRGEFWGVLAYETVSGCPACGGDYEEAYECESCGNYFTLCDLDEDQICENCREKMERKEEE